MSSAIKFQYSDAAHQADTALSGMWLFLATEAIFFGSLFLLALIYWAKDPAGIAAASARAEFGIGTANSVLLVSSSAAYTWGVGRARMGNNHLLFVASLFTAALAAAFLVLKLYEWKLDFDQHLFPGFDDFAVSGPARGTAALFWSFYFIATFLHALHMMVGLYLMAWIARSAARGRFGPAYVTPAENIGLYWSFVDMVWLCLYPVLYLPGRVLA